MQARRVAHKTTHPIISLEKSWHEASADVAGCAGDEDKRREIRYQRIIRLSPADVAGASIQAEVPRVDTCHYVTDACLGDG